MVPTTTSNPSSTTSHPTGFASLPREIRDEIYALTFTCDEIISLPFKLDANTAYGLLATQSSSSLYAAEARAFFFQNNKFSAYAAHQRLLDPAHGPRFDIRPWLRILHAKFEFTTVIEELVEQASLLRKCPRLQEVNVSMYGLCGPHRSTWCFLNAFQALETKLHSRLTFRLMDGYSTNVMILEELRRHMEKEWE